ncbi:3-oxoacyl-[bacterium]|nr:3-oxoacyl-[acyl-carrier-protein] reductase [bacterium]
MQDFDLRGSVAVVTGSGRGIGKAVACKLAEAGADVAIVDIAADSAEETAKEIHDRFGTETAAFAADLTKAEQVDSLFESIYAKFGHIDILINNAGITKDGLLMRMKDSDWQQVIDINLTSVYRCTKAVLKGMMKQRHGKIVNTASVVGIMGNAGQANYCASKAGVIGFTKAVAREVASRSINVNAVAPGFIQTKMTEVLSDSAKANIMSQVPLGTMGQAEDVAKAVLFLASPASDYITGQVLCVDGGMAM